MQKTRPTIAMIPSGYKASKLYSLLPSDGSGDFEVIRDSKATRRNMLGYLEEMDANIAVIDYKDRCGTLLIEKESTNYIISSDGLYGNGAESIEEAVSPFNDVRNIVPVPNSTSDSFQYTINGGTLPSGTLVTYSYYVKILTTPEQPSFGLLRGAQLTNGNNVSGRMKIDEINGYERFAQTFEIINGELDFTITLIFGNIVGVGRNSIAYAGHQLEEGSVATSLIPTSGGIKTRKPSKIFSNTDKLNRSEGTFLINYTPLEDIGSNRLYFSLNDGGVTNILALQFTNNGNLVLQKGALGGSNIIGQFPNKLIKDKEYNIAVSYKANDYNFVVNGEVIPTLTSTPLEDLTTIEFGVLQGVQSFEGSFKKVLYYDKYYNENELINATM